MKEFYVWNILVFCICKILSILYLLTICYLGTCLLLVTVRICFKIQFRSLYKYLDGDLADANTDAEVS